MKSVLSKLIKHFLRIFYRKEIIAGKWFDQYRGGYLWAIKSIPHRIFHPDRPWPYSSKVTIINPKNLEIKPSSINNLQQDIYFQNRLNKITVGENCYIAMHVGIITEQHDMYDLDKHLPGSDVVISDNCWIGMNAVIMPGVVLGPQTIVGANSVVTRSFPDGHVVIAGVPARVIRSL